MKQNLLLITFDQWRGDWADPNNPAVNLPALCHIASQGIHYERCYTSSPQCVPARLSWLSGKLPSIFGVTKNKECTVKKEIPSIFKRLKHNGYHTKIIGKTHWTSHFGDKDLRKNKKLYKELGFDDITDIAGPRALRSIKCELTEDWVKHNVYENYKEDLNYRYHQNNGKNSWKSKPSVLPEQLYPDIWIAKKGIKAIRKLPKQQPWLLWISFVGPHEPFDTPTIWRSDSTDNIPKNISKKNWITKLDQSIELSKASNKWKDTFNEKEMNEFRKDYADNLRLLDSLLKEIHEEAKKRNDWENTNTIVTSDHGEMLGDYGMLYKSTFLEPAIRVPMFVINPNKARAGSVIKEPVTSTDIITAYVKYLSNKKINKQPHTGKVIIEYGEERCFIDGNLKLVTDQDNHYLWSTIILKNGKELAVERGSKRWEKDSKKWDNIMKWALKKNKKLNRKRNKLVHHIE